MPLTGVGAEETLKISFYVPPGSPAVALFWDAVDPLSGRAIPYPNRAGPESTPSRRVAVATGYGLRKPALLRLGTIESRVASLAPPWLPQPLPSLLAVAGLLLGAALVAAIAAAGPYSAEDAEAEGGRQELAPKQPAGP